MQRATSAASPTSTLSWNRRAFVTRPPLTSKQAMTRVVSMRDRLRRSSPALSRGESGQQREPDRPALLDVELGRHDVPTGHDRRELRTVLGDTATSASSVGNRVDSC
jgi:hypothetical protein